MNKFLSIIVISCTIVFLNSCGDGPPKTDNSVVISESGTTEQSDEPAAPTESAPTTSVELIIQTTEEVYSTVTDIIKNRKTNDSISFAHREKMWAYQIGFPISDKDEVFEMYDKLQDNNDVYVLRLSRKDFYLIKYEGKDEKELRDSLESFKASLGSDIKSANVINLSTFCSKREKLKVDENLTKRREDTEIPCLVCD